MTTAQEVMTPAPQCVSEGQTLVEAARLMRDADVGALPVCGEDGKLVGIVTDRDIVVRCLAEDGDPTQALAGDLANGMPVYVDAADDIEDVTRVMQERQIRRVPVMEDKRLVGIISQADIALSAAPAETGETVAEISR